MPADAKIQARIDSSLKEEGERILADLGLTTTEFVRMTFRQLVMHKGVPFDVRIPNEETRLAIEEARQGIGLRKMTLEEFKEEYRGYANEVREGDQ